MDYTADFILDTVIGFVVFALCIAGVINLLGMMMYESTFGFGTLREKSSSDAAYTVEKGEFIGYGKKQYYMLPIVDTEDTRTVYRYNSDDTYTYSAVNGSGMLNMYNKIYPVLENTENSGNIGKIECYVGMDKNGTLKFTKGG